jgi:hypothetical protein
MIDRLDYPRNFVHESDSTSDMVQDRHLSNLLPRVWNVFEQLHDGVRHVFEGAKMYAFVISKLAVAHITMILDDFSNVFRRQILV